VISGAVPDEIREGPAAIRATIVQSRPAAATIAEALREADIRRVFVLGNGTSYHSSLAAAGLYRRLAGPDNPVVVPLTAAEFRTYPPPLGDADAVVGISSSGEFHDVVAVTKELRGRTPTIAVVHVADSTLATIADHVIVSAGGPSRVPVMTKTFSATLVATELLLAELLGPATADQIAGDLARAADHAQDAIEAAEAVVEDLAAELDGAEHLFVVGSGLVHVAAMEAALKLKEMALVHAEGTETWEMTSGASTIIGPGSVVVALAPNGPGRAGLGDVVRHSAGWGARVIEVGPDRLVPGSTVIGLPGGATEDHAPLTAVPPVALLAFALARARGVNPDQPDWIERYHSQGLTHILGVAGS
jgi:glucosamine--fructose-6-phosphate aminotransferase (isomerizing)